MLKRNEKTFRLLSISERLIDGSEVSVDTLANEFNVSPRTIKRDIHTLRDYIAQSENSTHNAIAYSESRKTYFYIKPEREWITAKEAITVAEILLKSDKFSKDEAATVLHKLITQVNPNERDEARKSVTEAYNNYKE